MRSARGGGGVGADLRGADEFLRSEICEKKERETLFWIFNEGVGNLFQVLWVINLLQLFLQICACNFLVLIIYLKSILGFDVKCGEKAVYHEI